MIDDFEAVMKKMEEIHSRWPSLRFCQVIDNVYPGSKYYIADTNLLTALEVYLENH
ncbi:hypothetical protein LCGC14_0814890 [marine sediment metagenome]|uniref:Uncharacterized protein n=1 Tax=marine sediment metagenome TaxID=412755 RepID=A0A0F9PKK9_9ZZZZ